jgi:hypothetical protein
MFIFFNYILQGVSKVLELLFFWGGGVMGQSERFIVKDNSKLGRHPKLLEFFKDAQWMNVSSQFFIYLYNFNFSSIAKNFIHYLKSELIFHSI